MDHRPFQSLPLRLLPPLIFLCLLPLSGARDMAASSASSPSTGMAAKSAAGDAEMTPLQKHVSFFDRNKDGLIYPSETYEGFRAIGFGVAFSGASALFVNGFLGPKTQPVNGKLGSLLLPIYVNNIDKGKHGSDSGVYDTEGRFVPTKFEEIFQKHAHTNPDALTSDELKEMLKANKDPKDSTSSLAANTEWTALYSLCKDKDGLLHKETIRSMYDGSLFYQMEREKNPPKGYND